MRRIFLEKNNFLSWLIVLVLAVFIFYISSLTFKGVGVASALTYVYHFFIFFWLAFFLAIALVKYSRIRFLSVSIILAAVYAVSDEFHQLFVLGRNCSFEDFLVDLAGILFATLLYLITIKIRKNKEEHS